METRNISFSNNLNFLEPILFSILLFSNFPNSLIETIFNILWILLIYSPFVILGKLIWSKILNKPFDVLARKIKMKTPRIYLKMQRTVLWVLKYVISLILIVNYLAMIWANAIYDLDFREKAWSNLWFAFLVGLMVFMAVEAVNVYNLFMGRFGNFEVKNKSDEK